MENFITAMVVSFDEFKAVKSELKQLQNEIPLSPKNQLQVDVADKTAQLNAALSRVLAPATTAAQSGSAQGARSDDIDTAALRELEESLSADQLLIVLESLVSDIENNGKEAVAAANRGEVKRLARACHTLKGLAASFGSPELETLASKIQAACRNDDISRAAGLALSGLETVCVNFLSALRAYTKTVSVRAVAS